MAVSAVVKDGKLVETASQSSVQNAMSKTGMDKEAFLKLLVAQMQYQDPLEPTSNTEFVSQYATFSQVEQLQNMAASMDLMRASGLVGKLVTIETTDKNGNATQVQGSVEYVSYINSKAYVSINGELYSADDIVAVIDETYQDAFDLAELFKNALKELPSIADLSIADKEAVKTLQDAYNSMTAYQQSFIKDSDVEKLQKYVARMSELIAIYEAQNGGGDDGTGASGDDGETGEAGESGEAGA